MRTDADTARRVVPATPPDPERRLRIALLGYRSNPYSGGQGVYISRLAHALARLGHEVDVLSGPPYPHLGPEVRLVRIPSLDLYAAPNHVTALRPRHLLSATDTFEYLSMLTGGFPEPYTFGRRVSRWLLRQGRDYDVVHDNQSLATGLLSLQAQGFPVVTTIHHPVTSDRAIALAHARNWRERLLIRRWHRFLRMQTRVARRLAHIVTVSERSRLDVAAAFDLPTDRLAVVYNGIDTEAFRPLPDVRRRDNRLMTVASADTPLKGLDYLLEALARLLAHRPELELVVVGRLKPGGPTERRIRTLGIADHVRFEHGIDQRALVRRYAEATLAVVPSLYEGFGLPAGEAMACGVPVISTCGGALPEVVGDAGVLVPPRDAQALANAVARLLDDRAERHALAARGRRRVVERFSWNVNALRMTRYYQQMLNGTARA